MEILYEMPRIAGILDLRPFELPHYLTGCARKQDLKMWIQRTFLELTIELRELGDIQAIDATGMDQISASQHYANRTKYSSKAVKTMVLVDWSTGVILAIHCAMTKPHGLQVGWQLLKRNLNDLSILTADKGYDWKLLRNKLQAEGVIPLIRARELGWAGIAEDD